MLSARYFLPFSKKSKPLNQSKEIRHFFSFISLASPDDLLLHYFNNLKKKWIA